MLPFLRWTCTTCRISTLLGLGEEARIATRPLPKEACQSRPPLDAMTLGLEVRRLFCSLPLQQTNNMSARKSLVSFPPSAVCFSCTILPFCHDPRTLAGGSLGPSSAVVDSWQVGRHQRMAVFSYRQGLCRSQTRPLVAGSRHLRPGREPRSP